jgi:hypothetical protein
MKPLHMPFQFFAHVWLTLVYLLLTSLTSVLLVSNSSKLYPVHAKNSFCFLEYPNPSKGSGLRPRINRGQNMDGRPFSRIPFYSGSPPAKFFLEAETASLLFHVFLAQSPARKVHLSLVINDKQNFLN